MVVRTTERIRVSEEELAEAVRVVESTLAELGLVADIEVTDDRDPEPSDVFDRNLLVAHIREELAIERLVDAVPIIGARLRQAELMYPSIPLVFHLFPTW